MKHLKIYENYQTEEEVAKICKKYRIKNWSINQDGLVDVNGDVDLRYKGLAELPLKFGIVAGYFNCSCNKLTTLEGAPKSVDGYFDCSYNKLTTLEGAPISVSGFYCNNNRLTNLEGAPKSVDGNFNCSENKLTTLEGAPESVGRDFWCVNNDLTTLEGAPQSVDEGFNCSENKLTTIEGAPYSVGGNFWCGSNPIPDLIKNNMKSIKHILANQEVYHIYNKDGTINEYRFRLMMDSMD